MQSFPIHLSLNPVAIVLAAVVQWVIGAAWYSPALFSKPWARMLKLDMSGKPKGLAVGMVASLVGDVLLCLVQAHVLRYAGAATVVAGVLVSVVLWLGFFVAPNLAQGIYEQRPFAVFGINQGYWLVCLTVSGAMLAVWK